MDVQTPVDCPDTRVTINCSCVQQCARTAHTALIKAARHKEHMLHGSTSTHLKTLTGKTQTILSMDIYLYSQILMENKDVTDHKSRDSDDL